MGRENVSGKTDQHAQPFCGRTGRQSNGVGEVARAIWAVVGGKPHGAGKDDSPQLGVIAKEQVGEEGRLLQRVGTVSDHDAFDTVMKSVAHLSGNAKHVLWSESGAGNALQINGSPAGKLGRQVLADLGDGQEVEDALFYRGGDRSSRSKDQDAHEVTLVRRADPAQGTVARRRPGAPSAPR